MKTTRKTHLKGEAKERGRYVNVLIFLGIYVVKSELRFVKRLLPLYGQGRGVGSTRKKLDAAALEDRDKPYACDSESYNSNLVLLLCLYLNPARGPNVNTLYFILFLMCIPSSFCSFFRKANAYRARTGSVLLII